MSDEYKLVTADDEETVRNLKKAGMRQARELQEERKRLNAWITAWPADSPLSEAELRAEIEGVLAEMVSIQDRMKDLYGRLPELADRDSDRIVNDELPEKTYFGLRFTVGNISDEVRDVAKYIRMALEATPETMWEDWAKKRSQGVL